MHWIYFALLAPAFFSTTNFIDKYIVRGKNVDYGIMPIYSSIMSLIYGSFFWWFGGFSAPCLKYALPAVLAGLLSIITSVLYFKALYHEATSRIIVLMQIVPVMVLLLSAVFLGEVITMRQLMGFFFILPAAAGLSAAMNKDKQNSHVPSPVVIYILAADLTGAVSSVLLKYATEYMAFCNVVSYNAFGLGLGGMFFFLVFPAVRRTFIESIKTSGKEVLGLIFFNEGICAAGGLLYMFAVSMGPVALVSVLGSTKVFFGILFGGVLTMISPDVFGEDISRKGMARSIILAIAMFAGVCFIY